MSDIERLRREIKVLSFDQYGTVVDMQGGLVAFATPFLKAKGWFLQLMDIYIDKDNVHNEDLPADTTIVVTKADFDQISDGKLDPTMAFMQGKLKVNGDMSVAMKLQPLLAKARGA